MSLNATHGFPSIGFIAIDNKEALAAEATLPTFIQFVPLNFIT